MSKSICAYFILTLILDKLVNCWYCYTFNRWENWAQRKEFAKVITTHKKQQNLIPEPTFPDATGRDDEHHTQFGHFRGGPSSSSLMLTHPCLQSTFSPIVSLEAHTTEEEGVASAAPFPSHAVPGTEDYHCRCLSARLGTSAQKWERTCWHTRGPLSTYVPRWSSGLSLPTMG